MFHLSVMKEKVSSLSYKRKSSICQNRSNFWDRIEWEAGQVFMDEWEAGQVFMDGGHIHLSFMLKNHLLLTQKQKRKRINIIPQC